MYVVTGATGHTGKVVAKTLLAQGKKVRAVVRNAAKAEPLRALGAEVVVADATDAAALAQAFRGADGVYLMVPPSSSDKVLADERKVVDAFANAVEAARPKHLVLLSSVGAQHEKGTGFVQSLHYAERRLGRMPSPLTALRAASFMENWALAMGTVREQSILPSMLPSGLPIPMVATEDIGRVAAEALLAGPAAPKVIELAGPEDYKTEDVAAALSKITGRIIQKVDVPEEGMESALKAAGFTDDAAGLYREMVRAGREGKLVWTQTPVRGRVGLVAVLRGLVG
jgi:uncharacterized protein YbjT (DUF2867 family)